jgi:hypothetical protein
MSPHLRISVFLKTFAIRKTTKPPRFLTLPSPDNNQKAQLQLRFLIFRPFCSAALLFATRFSRQQRPI